MALQLRRQIEELKKNILLNVSRQLERVADHAVNIAEDVIYMAHGDITQHGRPHPLPKPALP